MDGRLQNAPIGILEVATDGTVRAANPSARELLGIEDGSGQAIGAVFPESVESRVPRAFETPPDTEHVIEAYYPKLGRWLSVSIVPEEDVVYVYVQDETELQRVERRLDSMQADVDRLVVTNKLISNVLGELVAASDRTEIAETICTQLGETDLYEFAWVGEREVGTDDILMRATAGTENRLTERIGEELDGGATVPERRAVDSGELEIVQPIGKAESVPEPIRRAAFADGVQSLLAVPLTYGEHVYGVVGIYSANRDAFSNRERDSFRTVGEMAGFAINATRNRSILMSDTVVELTFDVGDPMAPFVTAVSDLNGTLSVSGVVPDGDRIICYLIVEGGDTESFARALAGAEGVATNRIIAEHETGGSLEVTLEDATPIGYLLTQGTTLKTATYEGDSGRIVVELPPEEDIRRVADAFTRMFDATIVAKRERNREKVTVAEFKDALADRLTDRQENALRTAFFADYFESPRGSTAEEVAGALGITGPTLLHHLRTGQRKLLEEYFETTDR